MGELFPTAGAVALAPWRALRWLGRGIVRRARLLVIIAAALVAVHLIATLITGVMLKREVARLRTAGVLLDIDELVPHLPEGASNAADIYQQAFNADRASDEDTATLFDVMPPDWGPEQFALAGPVLATNERYFSLLDEASRTPDCVFTVTWDDPLAAVFPHYAKMREGARMLSARAALSAGSGRIDAALADCAAMLRMAEHAKVDPTLIGQLVAYTIQSYAIRALEQACSLGTPTPATCRDLFDQIAAIDQVTPSVRSMKGETVFLGGGVFRAARAGGESLTGLLDLLGSPSSGSLAWVLPLYSTVGRPLLNLDEISFLRYMAQEVEAFGLPWPESQRREKAVTRKLEQTPAYRSVLTRVTTPVFDRALWSREAKTASLGSAQVALALMGYRSATGSYPDSLDQLRAAGWGIPNDPFGGAPYIYRRDGEGFIVYSIGPDMNDDGGLRPYWELTGKLSPAEMEQRKEHYDIPFQRPI